MTEIEEGKFLLVVYREMRMDGIKTAKYVEGEDAEKWNQMMRTVCVLADNPRSAAEMEQRQLAGSY